MIFKLKKGDGTWVTIDKAWKDENIETKSVPILGRITCHRLMWEPLIGAFNQIIEENLQSGLSKRAIQSILVVVMLQEE